MQDPVPLDQGSAPQLLCWKMTSQPLGPGEVPIQFFCRKGAEDCEHYFRVFFFFFFFCHLKKITKTKWDSWEHTGFEASLYQARPPATETL